MADVFPDDPGFVAGSETSREAAVSMKVVAGTLRAQVYDLIRLGAASGRTDDEIEEATGLRHQTASARRRELVLGGLVVDSGRKRRTRSGRRAIVWVVADEPVQRDLFGGST